MITEVAAGRTSSCLADRPKFDLASLNPTGMHSKVVTVTPEMAQTFLDSQINPRKPDRKRVLRYCEARKSGDWRLHHQGPAFNCDGRMIDGQHRMLMIVETGLPTAFYVTYNVPDDGVLHIDEQLPRSIQVALRAAGLGEYDNSVIAVARIIETLPKHAMQTYTRDEMLVLLKRHAEALDFGEKHARRAGLFTASCRSLIARAYHHADHQRLIDFCEIVKGGFGNGPLDSAAICFRNLLLNLRGSGGHAREVERYRKGQTALLSFLQKQPLSKLYGTETDLFPLASFMSANGDA